MSPPIIFADTLRSRPRAWLWDGEYRSIIPGKLHAHGSAFRAADGHHAADIGNNGDQDPITATLVWKDGQAPGAYCLVDDDWVKTATSSIVVPPRDAAVVTPELT